MQNRFWKTLTGLIVALSPSLATADMLPDADDPAFIAAITVALTTDDPLALVDLHALATAGNTAALVALHTVERWLPRTGSFKDRAALRRIDGTSVTDLANAASPLARTWLHSALSQDIAVQLDRATGLYAMGEGIKADTLMSEWLNQTGAAPPLPAGFADLPASAWLQGMIIESRLNPFMVSPTLDPDGSRAILTAWLTDDRIEGWIALSRLSARATGQTLPPDHTAYFANLVAAVLADLPPDIAAQAQTRMSDGALVWRAAFQHVPDPPLSDADVQSIWQALSPRAEFGPIRLFCTAGCPASPANCERAYIQAFGYQSANFNWFEPPSDAISPTTFYTSPRAERLLIAQGITNLMRTPPGAEPDTAAIMAIPALAAAAQTDACFAAAVTRVLTTPLPGGP